MFQIRKDGSGYYPQICFIIDLNSSSIFLTHAKIIAPFFENSSKTDFPIPLLPEIIILLGNLLSEYSLVKLENKSWMTTLETVLHRTFSERRIISSKEWFYMNSIDESENNESDDTTIPISISN